MVFNHLKCEFEPLFNVNNFGSINIVWFKIFESFWTKSFLDDNIHMLAVELIHILCCLIGHVNNFVS